MTSTRPNCSPRPDVDPLESHGRPGSYCHPGSDARPDFQKLYDQPVYLIYIDVIREPGWHCCFRLVQWTDRQEGRRQYSNSYGCRVSRYFGQVVPGLESGATDSPRSETDELLFLFWMLHFGRPLRSGYISMMHHVHEVLMEIRWRFNDRRICLYGRKQG